MTVLIDNMPEHSSVTTWVGNTENQPYYLVNSTVFEEPALSEKAKILWQKLDEFRLLEPNWDSYDAEVPCISAIHRAKHLIEQLDRLNLPLFFVAPGPNGEISIELKRDGTSAEIILESDGEMALLISKNEELIKETQPTNEGSLIAVLKSTFL